MPEDPDHVVSRSRLKQKARVAAFPLWLHIRAYSTLSLMMTGAIAAAISVLAGRPFSSAVEFFAVWCSAGLVVYWASFAWYALRQKLSSRGKQVAGA